MKDRGQREMVPPQRLVYPARGNPAEIRQAVGILNRNEETAFVCPQVPVSRAAGVPSSRNSPSPSLSSRPPSATLKALKEIEAQKLILEEEEKHHEEIDSLNEKAALEESKLEAFEKFYDENIRDKNDADIPQPIKTLWENQKDDYEKVKQSLKQLNAAKIRSATRLQRKLDAINKRMELDKREIELNEDATLDDEVANYNNVSMHNQSQQNVNESPFQSLSRRHSRPPTDEYYGNDDNQSENYQQQGGSEADNVLQQLTTALTRAIGASRGGVDCKLPFFDGNPAQWCNFKSAYDRMMSKYKFDKSEMISKIREALKEPALTVVSHMMSNPANVNKIMQVLEMRFGKPEQVLDFLADKARAAKPVQQNQPESVADFGTMIDALLTNIKSFKQESYLFDRQLLMELVKKLPAHMQSQWFEWLVADKSRERSLESFNTWIQPKVEAALLQVKPRFTEERERGRRGAGIHSANIVEDDSKEKEKLCLHCDKKNHLITECYKFKKLSTDDKWDTAKQKRLCFICLGKGHVSPKCTSKKNCTAAGCSGKHHSLLHRTSRNDSQKYNEQDRRNLNRLEKLRSNSAPAKEGAKPNEYDPMAMFQNRTPANMSTAITSGSLPIIPVKVTGPKGTIKVYALLDPGSNCTMIEDDIAAQLGLDGKHEAFRFTAFNEQVREEPNSRIVNLRVAGAFRSAKNFELNNIHTVGKLGVPGINLETERLKDDHPHLRCMKAKSLRNAVPQMLIGYRYMKLMAPRKILESETDNTPSAYQCHLGWYVCDSTDGNSAFCVCQTHDDVDNQMHQMIKDYFSLESFGVKLIKDSQRSKDDKRAIQMMQDSTKKINGRWETCLLWREENATLPESKIMAFNRLRSMEKKMDSDPVFAKLCMEKFAHYIEQGYLMPRKGNGTEERRWYLPWFMRFHPTKKPRLVFDAAAISHGKSLNSFLLKGPDLLRPLPAVLIRFRRHTIALTADIREMFHQVSLCEKDRTSQTLLFRGMERKKEPVEYEMNALFFGSTSSPSSAIYTKNLNAEGFADKYPEAVKATNLDFFMDDYLGGEEDEDKALQLQKNLTEIHESGGFPLVKWNSNSEHVLKSIPAELRANGNIHFHGKEDVPMEKALGMYWDSVKDEFGFKLSFSKLKPEIVNGDKVPTKRMMTGLVMALFDPMGFIAHFRIKGLIILQNVWRSQVGWDDEVPMDIFEDWKLWLQELKKIEELRIPRRLSPFASLKDADDIQLHICCDASSEAYSCNAYLRISTGGRVLTPLIMAKARVAPLKAQTIPRLELQAAVLGCRVAKAVREAFGEDLKISQTVFWSDSRTVLAWIRSSSIRYNQFVAARIGEILELSNVDEWRWVPTLENPADEATRLKKPVDLTSESRFLNGPSFLREPEENWPKEDKEQTKMDADLSKQKKVIHVAVKLESLPLPDVNRFSSWLRLIRATASVFRAIRRMRKIEPHFITVDDMKRAMKLWIRKAQSESFSGELQQLKKSDTVLKSSKLYTLSPLLDENGVIVLRGRIDKASVDDDVKRPPILDPRHPYTRLMVKWFHEVSHHFGQERVINELRKFAWIIDCRAAVRRCVSQCFICKLRKAQPVPPEMGQLPFGRLESGKPAFYFCSVDYFGPYKVKIKRSSWKRWGVLFSCQTTRAVHLEVADSLDTSSMINALVRFINIRGKPAHIWSDNGTNFVGAEREIRESLAEWNQEELRDQLATRGIQWHFIPPASPHMGGSWERLVGSTKKILSSILKEQEPSDEALRTMFTEIMGILNSRPITYASPDPNDDKCLTPNDLMQLKSVVGGTIPGTYHEGDMYRKSWRYGQKLTCDFWKRWSTAYLPWLAKRQKWHEASKPLEAGDLTIVLEDNAPRNQWKKGLITATFPGPDKQVRAVEVKVAHVDSKDPKKIVKMSHFRRPAMKICPLSLRSSETVVSGRENVAESDDNVK